MELQEVEKKEVHEESKDECVLMPSVLQGSSDKHQPYSGDKFNSNELEVDVHRMEHMVALMLKKMKFQPISQVAPRLFLPTSCVDQGRSSLRTDCIDTS